MVVVAGVILVNVLALYLLRRGIHHGQGHT